MPPLPCRRCHAAAAMPPCHDVVARAWRIGDHTIFQIDGEGFVDNLGTEREFVDARRNFSGSG